MNSNPYTLPALIFLAAVLFGCTAWAFLAITRQPAAGRHARLAAPNAEATRFGAYLRGEDEPEEQPVPPGAHHAGDPVGYDASYDHSGWWDEDPPQPPAVEILTGPRAPGRQTSAVTIRTLARVRDALMPDAWKPEPGQATFTASDPDATCTDLPAITGGYLPAPQPAGQLEVTP